MNKIKIIRKLIVKISKFFKRFFSNSNNDELNEDEVHKKRTIQFQRNYSHTLSSQTNGFENNEDSNIGLDTTKKDYYAYIDDNLEDNLFDREDFQLKSSESLNDDISEKNNDEGNFKQPVIEKKGNFSFISCPGDFRLVNRGKDGQNKFTCMGESYLDKKFINLLEKNHILYGKLDDEKITNLINNFINDYNYRKERAKELYEDYIQKNMNF